MIYFGHFAQTTSHKHPDLVEGTRYNLPDFVAEQTDDLRMWYSDLTTAEHRNIQDEMVIVCEDRSNVKHTNPKAMQWDVDASFASLGQEVYFNTCL